MTLSALPGSILEYLRNSASIILTLMDGNGRILEANAFAEKLTGKSLAGLDFTDILVDFASSFQLEQVLEPREEPLLLTVISHTGLPQSVYFRFMKQEGAILGFGEINMPEIETLRKNLIDLNMEYSNLNRELHKKNAQLSALNEQKNHYLGVAAHDLRSPLSAIRSLSALLHEDMSYKLDGDHREILTMIEKTSGFMLALLDDLLSVAKIESGKLDVDLQQADIIGFLDHSIRLNRLTAKKKNITLHFHHEENLPLLRFDVMKMEQVMNNLLSNAIKFSPRSTEVSVTASRDGDWTVISIADQGPGIPEKDREKLFKPFSRTSVRPPAGESSSGLGLYIVHKIVTGHGGNIRVESGTGKGATFHVYLPIASRSKEV